MNNREKAGEIFLNTMGLIVFAFLTGRIFEYSQKPLNLVIWTVIFVLGIGISTTNLPEKIWGWLILYSMGAILVMLLFITYFYEVCVPMWTLLFVTIPLIGYFIMKLKDSLLNK